MRCKKGLYEGLILVPTLHALSACFALHSASTATQLKPLT